MEKTKCNSCSEVFDTSELQRKTYTTFNNYYPDSGYEETEYICPYCGSADVEEYKEPIVNKRLYCVQEFVEDNKIFYLPVLVDYSEEYEEFYVIPKSLNVNLPLPYEVDSISDMLTYTDDYIPNYEDEKNLIGKKYKVENENTLYRFIKDHHLIVVKEVEYEN